MPDQKNDWFEEEPVEIEYKEPPTLPEEWVEAISRLNPITASVVWSVLTGTVTPETIALARFSPDYERFTTVAIVAGGNPKYCQEVCDLAREELEQIFLSILPTDPHRILH